MATATMRPASMSTVLTFSDFVEVTNVLMNVSLVSVGVLGIGLATILLSMERMNRAILNILIATIVLFIAAIIDLFDILRSEGDSTSRTKSIGIAVALFLSAGSSLRFFFLHRRASQPGRYETVILVRPCQTSLEAVAPLSTSNADSAKAAPFYHSTACWERWGTIGTILRFGLLGSITVCVFLPVRVLGPGLTEHSILILDVIWRIQLFGGFARFYASVYRASAALQIVFFITISAKMLDAARANPTLPRQRNVLEKLPLLIGNTLGLAIAIADLAIIPFSETSLGRFLLGVQLFIYLCDTVIAELHRSVRDSLSFPALPPEPTKREKSFVGIEGGSRVASTFRVSPPLPALPNEMEEVPGGRPGPVLRRGSRVPSWLPGGTARRNSDASDRKRLTTTMAIYLETGSMVEEDAKSPHEGCPLERQKEEDRLRALESCYSSPPSPGSDIAPLPSFENNTLGGGHRRDRSSTSSTRTIMGAPPTQAPPTTAIPLPPAPLSREASTIRDKARRRASRVPPRRSTATFDTLSGMRLSSPLDLAFPAAFQNIAERQRSFEAKRPPPPLARRSSETLLVKDIRTSMGGKTRGSSGSEKITMSRNVSMLSEGSSTISMSHFPSFPLPPAGGEDGDEGSKRSSVDSAMRFDSSEDDVSNGGDPFEASSRAGERDTIVVGADVFELEPPRMPAALRSSSGGESLRSEDSSVLGELTRFAGSRPVRNITSFIAARGGGGGKEDEVLSEIPSEPTTADLEAVMMRAERRPTNSTSTVVAPPAPAVVRGLPATPRPALSSRSTDDKAFERPRPAPLALDLVKGGERVMVTDGVQQRKVSQGKRS